MAAVGQRPDIEGKILLIGDRIVRGRLARKNSAVKWYRVNRVATIAASALTSIGLTSPLLLLLSDQGNTITLSKAFESWNGVPRLFSFLGVGVFVVGTVALAFYRQEKVEEKAIQSLSLVEAMERLEGDLHRHLEEREPMEQLLPLQSQVYALEATHFQAIPRRDNYTAEINDFATKTIDNFCKWWGDAPPPQERREKNA
jgi:hypothetical protein